ncbi:hypothetical protein [Streptomyces abikoensis]|uniref:hypothetical protein n=1 Tax=Streptomyces abikoensis TaxID=97398 RepID=UPI00167519A1|nr:hypothetical protein [Streptomyces abikoensis]GGP70908.1 hypothetical protein GCM10010214_52020 [Streptomyces abikoensis]
MSTGPRRAFLFGLTISTALTLPSPAWADDREPTAPAPSVPAVATTTTVFPSAPPSPVAGLLAGTVAGEGRGHPGRTETAPSAPAGASPSASSTSGGTPATAEGHRASPHSNAPGGAAPGPGRREAVETDRETERVMRVLPLGTGMTLTGLGLGFIALRLRRR